jgi:GNAT superfamily N-acetyltransferase
MTKLTIKPLTPDLWPALEDLFGPTGATSGCWCMWWRLGHAHVRLANSENNKAAFKDVVKKGPPPGLLALDGDRGVGWCQVTPRSVLPRLERSRVVVRLGDVDDSDVWSVSCFYIRRDYRRRGVMSELIDAAVRHARGQGASALEAYPWDGGVKRSSAGVYTGISSAFTRAGFQEVARRSPVRSTMRHDLRTARRLR